MGRSMVLADRYELLSPLGRGGMGQVWEGEDRQLERRVAIKLLTEDTLAGHSRPDELARRFAREAAVTAGLRHPGVPAVHDAGTYDGGLFLVLELITGRTLGDLIAEEGPLPLPWAAGIAAQVAAVLAAAHERGFIHRDIKPQNVMITGDGAVKVLDFGVAALTDQATISRLTRTGQPIGTPAYMAPEQLRGLPATPRTDLYALGCLLYEMLAGDPVFDAGSPAELMHRQLEQSPAPLRRDDLPAAIDALIGLLLEKDPARRPATARETYDRLLPHVVPPGPLGEIDARGRAGGTHLYSRVLVRLSGADAPRPAPDPHVASPTRAAAGPHAAPGPLPAIGSPEAAGRGNAVPVSHGGSLAFGRRDGLGRPVPAEGPITVGGPGSASGPLEPGGLGWKVRHSLWTLPTLLFGMGTWLSFGYLAVRHRRPSWLATAAVYLVLAVLAFVLVGSGPDNDTDTAQTTVGMVLGLLLWPAGIIHALWVNATTHLRLLEPARSPLSVGRAGHPAGHPQRVVDGVEAARQHDALVRGDRVE
ncbi:serine/threonine protein kinase [Actinoallomurus purpureus]|uniref:serine/threonine-protein kinase n=1 Tax=Actinoallomurus purpureus TaxID=478114 RepID=UPI002092C830|nr:serine/threonine-protein kinase [Actinoallomurus purpureus]MCO6008859.1 serine/threonine protein kinase [Actinoallomurus purpureus]